MDSSWLESRIANLRGISAVPDTLIRLNEIARNPSSSAEDFARCIAHDPALAARVIRTANSTVFCPPGGSVRTLRHAVVVLGVRTLRGLAVAFSVQEGLGARRGRSAVDRTLIWSHSAAVGGGARIISLLTQSGDPNEAFVAGLLHDIGILILDVADPDSLGRAVNMAQRIGLSLFDAEQKLGKFTHEDWGSAAARYWNLPDLLINAAGYHHRPWKDKETPDTTACVHLSDCLAGAHGLLATCGAKPGEIAWEVAESIALPTAQLDEIAKVMVNETEAAKGFFGHAATA